MSLPLSLGSCIGDDRGDCVQHDVSARLADKMGHSVPDSMARRSSAYLFLNGKYERNILADPDGRYPVSYNGCDAVSLVVFGDKNINGFTLFPVTKDVNETDIAVRIDSLLQPADSAEQSRLYYGNLDYSRITPEEDNCAEVCMYDRLARLHVILDDLSDFYGPGKFSVVLGNLRNTLTYGGTVTDDTVSVSPVLHREADGTLVSGTVATFPSMSPIKVSVYKDGVFLVSTYQDSSSRPITLSDGDDKAIVIMAGHGLFKIRVMPWSEYLSQSSIL